MKTTKLVLIVILALITSATWAGSRHRSRTHFSFAFGPYWGWHQPQYYPYYSHPVIIEREPVIYIERAPEPVIPEVTRPADSYWYYCASARGYYPYVKQCPDAWIKVVPQSPPTKE